MRVFPDTNVLLSGLLVTGLCAQLMHRLIESEHDVLIGEPVAREFVRIATEKFKVPAPTLSYALEVLRRQQMVAGATAQLDDIADPDDVPILACALAAQSDLFVTGDKALLELARVKGLPLLSPRDAWMRLFGAG